MKTKSTHIAPNIVKRPNIRKSYSNTSAPVKNEILGVDVTNDSSENILEFIIKSIENSAETYYITTPNPEMVVFAQSHPDFKSILNGAKLALADGIGLLWAGQIVGKSFKSRVTGVDTMKRLCEKVSSRPITVGFLGGRPGIAEKTAECLKHAYPNLKVVFISQEWSEEGFDVQPQYLVSSIKYLAKKENILNTKYQIPNAHTIGVDILFVAFGFPKQELWMAQHLNKIPVRVMMGVGGAFDYISGKLPRAPKFVRDLGLEWAFRLLIQPWRLKRQLALPKFVWMVLKEKFYLSLRGA